MQFQLKSNDPQVFAASLTVAVYDDASTARAVLDGGAPNKGVIVLVGPAAAARPIHDEQLASHGIECFESPARDEDGLLLRECVGLRGRYIVASAIASSENQLLPPLSFDIEIVEAGGTYVEQQIVSE